VRAATESCGSDEEEIDSPLGVNLDCR
jgi:hypothetical protein